MSDSNKDTSAADSSKEVEDKTVEASSDAVAETVEQTDDGEKAVVAEVEVVEKTEKDAGGDEHVVPVKGDTGKEGPASEGSYVKTISDLSAHGGIQDPSATLKNLVDNHEVLVISKSHCPFCLEVKRTFTDLGVPISVVEINQVEGGSKLHKAAKESTNHSTVPSVYIKSKHIGGCDNVKSLQASGELAVMIEDLVKKQTVLNAQKLETVKLAPVVRGKARNPLFWFPNVVNNYVIRLTGVQVVALCILGIIFREELWGQWLTAFILFDFCCRFFAGGSVSLLAMIATVITSPFKPQFRAGPPKQFAASCGIMFSLISTACYFTGHPIPGAVVLGMLAGAAGLEGFGDFCLGCVFFGWGVRFKLIPEYVYRIYTNTKDETEASWEYLNLDSKADTPEFVDTDENSRIALKYKRKAAEYTKDDFNMIRNMQIGYFGMPLAIAGLSVAFKLSSPWLVDWAEDLMGENADITSLRTPIEWYQTFGIASIVFFGIMFILYFLRLCMYPKKVLKEWQCPLRGPAFGMVTICFMLYSFLVYDVVEGPVLGRVFWWIGAVPHMTMTIIKFGELLGKLTEIEHFHITWMILPVGNLVGALVCPLVRALPDEYEMSENVELGQFYFSFAALMWIVLFVTTFFKAMTTYQADDRHRPNYFIWLAGPCVVGLSQFVLCTTANPMDPKCSQDFKFYYFIGLVFVCGLSWAFLPYIGFFGRNKFDMNYWSFLFPLSTLGACASVYYGITGYYVAQVLMVMILFLCAVGNGLAFLHTCASLIRKRSVFTPSEKWGPLSFMKLTHEAFRGGLSNIEAALNRLDSSNRESIEKFAAIYSQFTILHEEHAKHEDEVIFKHFDDMFPDHGKKYFEDHEEDRVLLGEWFALVNTLLDDTVTEGKEEIVAKLKEQIPKFITHFLDHLLGEELNLNPIGRKYVPLGMQKQLCQKAFAITPADRWEVIIPFVVNNCPHFKQRVRYLKCLVWAQPERAQQFGAIVYRNVDAVMWERLAAEVPEVIPRGEYNWWRYY